MSKKKAKSVTVPGLGLPCPRCGVPTEIREHVEMKDKHRAQPFYYSRWFNCANPECQTTLIMRDEFKILNDPGQAEQVQRTKLIAQQLNQGDRPPWE